MIEDIAPFFWNWTFFGIWKVICYISRKTFWVNLFSEFFQICIGHWAKTVSAFWLECLEKCCHHCILRVQINTCRKKFWGKSFSSLPDIEKKCFSLSLTMFWRGCHYCILRLQRIILKIFVKKLFVSQFLTMSKKRWCFCWKIFGQTIIPRSACPGESFEEQQFFKKKLFFFRHQISSEMFSVFCRNFLGRPAKTVIRLSKGTIWEKYIFHEKSMYFSFNFGKTLKKVQPCGSIFSMGFQEEHATYTKKTFWSNFSWECFRKLPSLSRRDIFRTLANKYFYRFVKNAAYLSTSPFGWLLSSLGKRPLLLNQFRLAISEFVSGLLRISFQLDFSELRSTYTDEHL